MGTALIIKGADFYANAVGDIGETGSGSNKLGKPIVNNEYFNRLGLEYEIMTVNEANNATQYCRTQPIRVTPGKVLNITIPGFSDFSLRAVLYDASDNNITKSSQGIVMGPTYTIPANAVKIGISICTDINGSYGGVLTVIPYETAKNMTIRLS